MNIKIVHLLSHPEEEREVNSIYSINKLDIPYIQHVNPVFTGESPQSKWPSCEGPLNKAAYGCYDSHKKSFNEFDTDYLLVCECDCMISVPPKQFVDILPFYIKDMEENNIACLGIGSFCNIVKKETKELYICEEIVCTQCMLYSSKHKKAILELFQNEDWQPYDRWLSQVLGKNGKLAVVKQRITNQHRGHSLIDGFDKRMEKRIDANGTEEIFTIWSDGVIYKIDF
jgi:GR25 family glycosyltransferase involved in LPS biosynthesis